MAYVVEKKQKDLGPMHKLLPMFCDLPSGQEVQLVEARVQHHEQMRVLLNSAIENGASYPQEHSLNPQQFEEYYMAGNTFCVIPTRINEGEKPENSFADEVLGCFYIKPNFPGHCSHICNGGFLTKESARRQGIARFMAYCYLDLARALEYRASMFNLVFVTNVASVNLWRSMGFKEIGVIPQAGYYPDNGGYIDAIQFYYDLTTLESE